jgi:PhoH-like ATPase
VTIACRATECRRNPYLNTRSNGLSYLIDRMKGQSIYAHTNLTKDERSTLADLASNLL